MTSQSASVEYIDIDIDIDPPSGAPWDDEITQVNPARFVVAQAQSERALAWMAAHPEVKTLGEAITAVVNATPPERK